MATWVFKTVYPQLLTFKIVWRYHCLWAWGTHEKWLTNILRQWSKSADGSWKKMEKRTRSRYYSCFLCWSRMTFSNGWWITRRGSRRDPIIWPWECSLSTSHRFILLQWYDVSLIIVKYQAFTQALYNLAVHPEYVEPLHQEVETLVSDEGWTYSTVTKMNKLDSFLKESMRMYPVGQSNPLLFCDWRCTSWDWANGNEAIYILERIYRSQGIQRLLSTLFPT